MSGLPFHQTRTGQRFYEQTCPDLVHELSRLNDVLERLVIQLDRGQGTRPGEEAP